MPVAGSIVAIDVLEDDHTPPLTVFVSVVVEPGQALSNPPMAVGIAFTVTTMVALQPEPRVYVMIAVPAATPVTTPELATVATEVLLLLQDSPPDDAQLSAVVPAGQTEVAPVILAANGVTVKTLVT
jgi:hypothetical protein